MKEEESSRHSESTRGRNHRIDPRSYEKRKGTFPCNDCEQVCASQSALIKHKQRKHGAVKHTRTTTAAKPVGKRFVLYKPRNCPVPGCKKKLLTQAWADFHFRVRGRHCDRHNLYHEMNVASSHVKSTESTAA